MPQPPRKLVPLKQGGSYVRTKDGARKLWAVYLPAGSPIRRKFFPTQRKAEEFCETMRRDLANLGAGALALDDETKEETLACLRKLARYTKGGHAVSLSNAVDYYIREAELTLASLRVRDAADDFLAHLRKKGRSLRYIEQAGSNLKNFCRAFGEDALATLRRAKIQTWLDDYTAEKQLSLATQRNLAGTAKVFLGWCERRELIPSNPAKGVECNAARSVKRDRLMTPSELKTLLTNAPPRIRPAVALMALAGVRVAEVARLRWEDIEGEVAHIDEDASKTKTDRQVRLTPKLARYLKAASSGRRRQDYIFPANVLEHGPAGETDPRAVDLRRGRLLIKQTGRLRKFLKREFESEQNTLRASCASYLVRLEGYPAAAAQLGHDEKITKKNYKQRRVSAEDAAAWFEVDPARPGGKRLLTWKEFMEQMEAEEQERAELAKRGIDPDGDDPGPDEYEPD